MCRALKVMCVAPDPETLAALKRAAVSAEWELTPGSTDEDDALAELERERPHVVVVVGRMSRFVAGARRAHPYLRIVSDGKVDEPTVVIGDLSEVRAAIKGMPRPAGPVT